MIGKPYEGIKSPTLAKIEIPILSDIPILGPMIFSHDAIVYFSIFIVALVAFVINKTRIGLVLRAVGENQEAAHALGYKVCLLYTSPSPRDRTRSRMPSSA